MGRQVAHLNALLYSYKYSREQNEVVLCDLLLLPCRGDSAASAAPTPRRRRTPGGTSEHFPCILWVSRTRYSHDTNKNILP